MPKLNVTVAHTLGQAEAGRRLKDYISRFKERHADQVKDLSEEWDDSSVSFAFSTFGLKFKGRASVSEDAAAVDCDLPFAAMMFKGKIEKDLRERLTRVLSPAYQPGAPPPADGS